MRSAVSIFGSSSAACGPRRTRRLQIGGRHPQFASDLTEIGGVYLAHFPQSR
jgi:hypothetical protein